MKLIVGLGNPEDKYKNNRHNIGFWLVDEISQCYSAPPFQHKFKGECAKISINGSSALLLKPLTYMNLSGESIRAAADFYKIELDDIYIIHDDLDLAPLKLRFKKGGGDGGHNGLKSATQHLNSPEYNRIRIGIGRPQNKGQVSKYVLSDFSKEEMPVFKDLCKFLAPRIGEILKGNGNDVAGLWGQSPVFTPHIVK